MKDLKQFVSYAISLIMTGLAVATYWFPELVNYVAAYAILNIVLGIFITVVFGLASLFKKELKMKEHPEWGTIVKRSKSILENPVKVIIDRSNKVISVCVLIYFGWVVTGVLLGIVSITGIVAVKSLVKED